MGKADRRYLLHVRDTKTWQKCLATAYGPASEFELNRPPGTLACNLRCEPAPFTVTGSGKALGTRKRIAAGWNSPRRPGAEQRSAPWSAAFTPLHHSTACGARSLSELLSRLAGFDLPGRGRYWGGGGFAAGPAHPELLRFLGCREGCYGTIL